MRVKDVMTPNVICVGIDEPVLKAARLMLQNRIRRSRSQRRSKPVFRSDLALRAIE